MKRFYYIELYKLSNRRDVFWSLLIAVSLPLLIGLLAKTGSKMLTIGGKFPAMGYAIITLDFLRDMFFFYFIFIILTSSIFAGELEKGNLSLLLIRSESRVRILLSKVFALITVLIVFIFSIILSGIISYYVFLYNTKFATNEFLGKGVETALLYTPFLLIFEIALLIMITALLSLFFNVYKTNLLSIGLVILMKVLEKVDKIKAFIPTYLANTEVLSTICKTEHKFLIKALHNSGILSIYIAIFLILALSYFSKMEIKN